MTRRVAAAATLWLVVTLFPLSTRAQEAEDSDHVARAQQLFGEATDAYERHNYATAARLFREVHALMDGHPRQYLVLFNLAQCLMDAGIYDEATTTFEQYLQDGGDRVENRGEVDQKLARIRELMGVDDGSEGSEPQGPTVPPTPSGPDQGLMTGGVAALSVGALGLVTMGIFGGLALSEHENLRAGCGSTSSCSPSDIADSDTFALVADMGLIVGAAGVATGVVLLVLALSGSNDAPSDSAVSLWLSPDGGGAVGRLRW